MNRCAWPNLETNDVYIEYHDNEWGVASYDDRYLFEMILLESFHCGLSWLIILKKREEFRKAFDNFEAEIIQHYDEDKIQKLMQNAGIVRNEKKIRANINNAKRFLEIQKEFGTFRDYIWSFTDNKIVYIGNNTPVTKNELSDRVTKNMKKRGFKFMGSVTTYSYLEAIGIMNNHSIDCFKHVEQA